MLFEFRSEQEDFIDNSFDPIIAYGKHAAIVHYFATPETDIPLEPSGFLLADTGGHYKEGTTDITRTVVMVTNTVAIMIPGTENTTFIPKFMRKK